MESQRSAAGASVLALLALAVAPVLMYFVTRDLATALVGGFVVGSVTAYLILLVAMATSGCRGYLEGATRIFFGGEGGGAGGYAGWGLTATSALAMAGIVVRIWRSEDPLRKVLGVAGVLLAAAAASFALVVAVMAFGDLVDRLLKRGGAGKR
jgi:hypothetical protein